MAVSAGGASARPAGRARGPLEEATAQLRERRPEPPPELVERVMRRVRTETRPGRLLSMPCASGSASVSEAAVREAVTRALDAGGAVLVSHCTVTPAAGGGADVELAVHARWEGFDAGSPDLVRASTTEALRTLFGLTAGRIDLAVEDLAVEDLVVDDPAVGGTTAREDADRTPEAGA